MRLGLFLSRGGSLRAWRDAGLLSRELRLYLAYLEAGTFERVTIFSYDPADAELLRELAKTEPAAARIDLIVPTGGLRASVWAITGVLTHCRELARCDVFKTNQGSGSWAALLASRITGRPLVFRQGYILSQRLAFTGNRFKARLAHLIENAVARRARFVVVSGEAVSRRYADKPAFAGKVRIIPSFVDTAHFTAKEEYDFDDPLIRVGRLHANKNLTALIDACASEQVALTMVGEGPERAELERHACSVGADVRFIGRIDNAELPALLREHTVFILPSLIEGLPKVLIEAMACGLCCIGSEIPGIVELLDDGRTGYLIRGYGSAAIAAQIRRVRGARDSEVGRAARRLIEQEYGLQRYLQLEGTLLQHAATR